MGHKGEALVIRGHRLRRRSSWKATQKQRPPPIQHAPQFTNEAKKEYPNVREQANSQGFQLHYVDGSKLLPGPYHYNSSLLEKNGELFLAYRDQDEDRHSRIGLARLDGEAFAPHDLGVIELPSHFKYEQHEDPRLFWFQGSVWLSYCAWDRVGCVAQAIVRLDDDWKFAEELRTTYGNNWSAGRWQKNWVAFEHSTSKLLHFVYQPQPHEVISLEPDGSPAGIFRTRGIEWAWGQPRGGTPPVKIGGLYWSFFHSRLMTPHGRFRYFMGAYSFQPFDQFEPFTITSTPILAGSPADPNLSKLPLVVFPNGAVLKNGEWIVSLGVNDVKTAILRIPHADLTKRMIPCLR